MPTPESTPERILQRIDWKIIRRLDGLLQGDYRSLFYGYGVDFADLREYQPGDDIRYIDWNVTARMDSPYIRQYVEDREISAWFLLDLSPSMDFGTVQSQKRAVLIDFVTTLARLLTRHGNRVGAMFYDSRIERTIPARSGQIQVLRLVNDLLKQPLLSKAPFTDLSVLLTAGMNAVKQRSLVFVISDFISAPGWEKPLNLLNRRHEVLAIRLWDPRELELPDLGPMIMEDAETGEQIYVDTHDKRFRQRFREAARQREAMLNAAFKRAKVDALSLSTDEDLVRAIVRFSQLRKQRRLGRALHVIFMAYSALIPCPDPGFYLSLPADAAAPPAYYSKIRRPGFCARWKRSTAWVPPAHSGCAFLNWADFSARCSCPPADDRQFATGRRNCHPGL